MNRVHFHAGRNFELVDSARKGSWRCKFRLRQNAANDFLIKFALQNQSSRGARTYVLTRVERVTGYYSLASASVSPVDAPDRAEQDALIAHQQRGLSQRAAVSICGSIAPPHATSQPYRNADMQSLIEYAQ